MEMEMKQTTGVVRKVMVVAEPCRESMGALQWALSHAVLEHDELILLHIKQASSRRNSLSTFLKRSSSLPPGLNIATTSSIEGGGDVEFLEEMKNACRSSWPKMKVQIERVEMEGTYKAATILLHSESLAVDLLIIGQRRSLSAALLGCKLSGGSRRGLKRVDTAEYLIENSKCTCVGVQKKGQNEGYLLNTKKHRNFWLLA